MKGFRKWLLPVAIVSLLLAVLIGGSCAPQPLGEVLDPSGNPFAHRFSDMKDIRTATFVVAASDSEHRYEADYFCDATADEVEINAALAAVSAGGTVQLMEGTFHLSASIEWPARSGVCLKGSGVGHTSANPGGTILYLDDDANCSIIVADCPTATLFATISNMMLYEDKTHQTASSGIEITGWLTDFKLERLFIYNVKNDAVKIAPTVHNVFNIWLRDLVIEYPGDAGIHLDGSTKRVSTVYLTDCYFTETGKEAFKSTDADAIRITHCHISGGGSASAHTYDGISITGGQYLWIEDSFVYGDDFRYVIYLDDANRVFIGDNMIGTDGGTCGIYCHDGNDLIIHDNWFYGARAIDINHANVVSPSVHHNNWRNCTNDPLYAAATDSFITNNIDKDGVQWTVDNNPIGIEAWVEHDTANPSLGTIPAGSYVMRVHCHVTEAFNSGGADDAITVGYDADVDAFGTSIDVTTTGIKSVPLGAEAGYEGTERAAEAYYTHTGGNPTQGKALIKIELQRVPTQP